MKSHAGMSLCGTTPLVIVIDKGFSVSNLLFKYQIFSVYLLDSFPKPFELKEQTEKSKTGLY